MDGPKAALIPLLVATLFDTAMLVRIAARLFFAFSYLLEALGVLAIVLVAGYVIYRIFAGDTNDPRRTAGPRTSVASTPLPSSVQGWTVPADDLLEIGPPHPTPIANQEARLHRHRYYYTLNTHAMERKNITIREDQSAWVDQTDVNLSQLVQEAIDDRMSPTEDELAQAYRENAHHAAETNDLWAHVSTEADDHLGPHPGEE